jgi:hypothetical protein
MLPLTPSYLSVSCKIMFGLNQGTLTVFDTYLRRAMSLEGGEDRMTTAIIDLSTYDWLNFPYWDKVRSTMTIKSQALNDALRGLGLRHFVSLSLLLLACLTRRLSSSTASPNCSSEPMPRHLASL